MQSTIVNKYLSYYCRLILICHGLHTIVVKCSSEDGTLEFEPIARLPA